MKNVNEFSYEFISFVNEVIDDAFANVFMFRGGSLDLFAFLTGEGQ